MDTGKKLPIYKLKINESDNSPLEVDYIALVDEPAILIDWQKFNKKIKFASDAERKLIMGPLMIADMPIYRRDEVRGEYYVLFDKQEILKVVEKFFRNGSTSNFNIMHDAQKQLDGVYLIESFIIDSSRGVQAPDAFKDLPQGSWLATVKVDNELVWQNFIKTGELKGFSVEGLFSYEQAGTSTQTVLEEIIGIITS